MAVYVSRFSCISPIVLALALGGCGPSVKTMATDARLWGLDYQPKATLVKEPLPDSFKPNVAIIADSQLNNLYGGAMVMSSEIADRYERVAIRPPALDLWSEVVLSGFVNSSINTTSPSPKAETTPTPSDPPLVVFLGDAGNIACTTEFSRFANVMNDSVGSKKGIWLMVHGNHDSFSMGNLNAWGRSSDEKRFKAAANFSLKAIDQILDVQHSDSEYTPAEARMLAYDEGVCVDSVLKPRHRSWAAACADPTGDGMPMYKGAWVRRYLSELKNQKVQYFIVGAQKSETPVTTNLGDQLDPALCAEPRRFIGRPSEVGSPLGERNFFLSGQMYSRDRVGPKSSDTCKVDPRRLNSYRSFVVQSLQVAPGIRGILIDTDHRSDMIGTGGRPQDIGSYESGEMAKLQPFKALTDVLMKQLPGVAARIEDDQFSEIQEHINLARQSSQQIIFFAHHPMADLPEEDRNRLLLHKPLAYISGHTHFESSVMVHKINGSGELLELNAASTTDWPMESMLLDIDTNRIHWKILGARTPEEVAKSNDGAALPGYAMASWVPDKATCERLAPTRDYNARRKISNRFHNLCSTEQELESVAKYWPGDKKVLQTLLASPEIRKLPLDKSAKAVNMWPAAKLIQSTMEELRRQAMVDASSERNFALCQAIGASRDESTTHTNETVERTTSAAPPLAHSAARYSGAQF